MGYDIPTFSSTWYECKYVHVTGYQFECSSVVAVACTTEHISARTRNKMNGAISNY
jgi:hypothetical protein